MVSQLLMVSKDHTACYASGFDNLCCCGDFGVKGPRRVYNNKIKIKIAMITQCDSVREVANRDGPTHMYRLNLQLSSVLWIFTV